MAPAEVCKEHDFLSFEKTTAIDVHTTPSHRNDDGKLTLKGLKSGNFRQWKCINYPRKGIYENVVPTSSNRHIKWCQNEPFSKYQCFLISMPPTLISKFKFSYDKYSVDKFWTKIYCHFYFRRIALNLALKMGRWCPAWQLARSWSIVASWDNSCVILNKIKCMLFLFKLNLKRPKQLLHCFIFVSCDEKGYYHVVMCCGRSCRMQGVSLTWAISWALTQSGHMIRN